MFWSAAATMVQVLVHLTTEEGPTVNQVLLGSKVTDPGQQIWELCKGGVKIPPHVGLRKSAAPFMFTSGLYHSVGIHSFCRDQGGSAETVVEISCMWNNN